MDERRWRARGFLGEARAWIDARVARTGEAEQVHVTPWSTVLRVPTADGAAWFKANDPALAFEAALVDRLASLRAHVVPPLIASDAARGWLLMGDAGERLREVVQRERSLRRWHEVLARYADLQLAAAPGVDDLLGLGVPDRRLERLPRDYADLCDRLGLREQRQAVGEVEELCARLAESGLPDTVQHDDLHDGQVFLGPGGDAGPGPLVLDWADACVTHPFLTLAVTLGGVIGWGVDDVEGSEELGPHLAAYLGPFRAAYPSRSEEELAGAATIALRLGWACRAVNGHVPGQEAQTRRRLEMLRAR